MICQMADNAAGILQKREETDRKQHEEADLKQRETELADKQHQEQQSARHQSELETLQRLRQEQLETEQQQLLAREIADTEQNERDDEFAVITVAQPTLDSKSDISSTNGLIMQPNHAPSNINSVSIEEPVRSNVPSIIMGTAEPVIQSSDIFHSTSSTSTSKMVPILDTVLPNLTDSFIPQIGFLSGQLSDVFINIHFAFALFPV